MKPNGVYVDATFGRGGHSAGILQSLGEKGRLIAIDQDPEAIIHAETLSQRDPRVTVIRSNFEHLKDVLETLNLVSAIDGIFMDLGVSSPQLDDAERGFSFMRNGPLDMRMDPDNGLSAADWLYQTPEAEVVKALFEYGEEKFARRIAAAITAQNQIKKLDTTEALVKVIDQAMPRKEKHKHPATRTFQAIRIAVNRELQVLPLALESALECLNPGGRLVVLSFHSLEDRIVKRFMRDKSKAAPIPRGMPMAAEEAVLPFKLIGKAVKPGADEIAFNPRSRSAVLRIAEKIQ